MPVLSQNIICVECGLCSGTVILESEGRIITAGGIGYRLRCDFCLGAENGAETLLPLFADRGCLGGFVSGERYVAGLGCDFYILSIDRRERAVCEYRSELKMLPETEIYWSKRFERV